MAVVGAVPDALVDETEKRPLCEWVVRAQIRARNWMISGREVELTDRVGNQGRYEE